jgi:hypothetical protein
MPMILYQLRNLMGLIFCNFQPVSVSQKLFPTLHYLIRAAVSMVSIAIAYRPVNLHCFSIFSYVNGVLNCIVLTTFLATNFVAKWVVHLFRIPDIPQSNLGPETSYPD